MDATLNYLELRAKEIKDSLTHFMLNHSAIAPRNIEEVVCMSPEGDRYYADMDNVGTKMQSYLSECYRNFYLAIEALMKDAPEEVSAKLSKFKDVIARTIDHRITYCESSRQALNVALAALEDQINIVKENYKPEE